MSADPIAVTVHNGRGVPPAWHRDLIAAWLTANGIDPADVHAEAPIRVITVPYTPSSDDGSWYLKVIVFTQLYVNADGAKEVNFLTHEPVAFQRTVPVRTPFPADPTADGEAHGQADRQAAQEAAQVIVRDQEQAGVSPGFEGQGSQRPRSSESARNEGAEEGGSSRGHQALSEPEEDRRQEEVEAAQ
ncbi:hypothetical protein [Streptomyces sp. NPDC055105]|uniref:hypothetical protein n=1 Tax=Streptomyces sp. NPDC055105 TaxID=3365719 RepID=UPI0037D7DC32